MYNDYKRNDSCYGRVEFQYLKISDYRSEFHCLARRDIVGIFIAKLEIDKV